MQSNNSWQFTIALITAIVVFGGGSVAAMILGRDIPGALWAIDGGLANALVAHAGFFTQRAMNRDSLGHMMGAVDHMARVSTGTAIPDPTTGETEIPRTSATTTRT